MKSINLILISILAAGILFLASCASNNTTNTGNDHNPPSTGIDAQLFKTTACGCC